jgi:phosphate transport system substrate-binding protein
MDFAASHNTRFEVMPCALDAFVFIVNDKNPIQSLTTEQIRSLYSGELNRWDQVGGTQDSEVVRFRRPENSGSEVLMKDLVMKDKPMIQTSFFFEEGVMSSVYNKVSTKAGGLAYSVGFYERFMVGSAHTRVIAVDGVLPTPENIRNGSYPHIAEVVAVIRADLPHDSPARQLRDWLLSPEGQSVVTQSGYSPLVPTGR